MKASQQKVDKIITDYETQEGFDLVPLMNMRKELAAQLYWYNKILAEADKGYRTARANRKRLEAELTKRFKQGGNSVAADRAEMEADEDYRKAYDLESQYEGSRDAGKRLCDAIDKVLSSMMQDIADLRGEKKDFLRSQNFNAA